ncbi:uncharacterized protein METZ01_LOCUS172264 [marine metagenome]|uniref:Uncharacterized protein n=1 Tax=marine metagenome TaxID=408172 RepID=A0A382C023_9ZZZZ
MAVVPSSFESLEVYAYWVTTGL